MTSEYKQLTAMLDRAGVGYGTRLDYDTGNTAVMVEGESEDARGESGPIAEFLFDPGGTLIGVHHYFAEAG